MKLNSIKPVVLEVMEKNEKARDDDMLLYALVCRKFNADIPNKSFTFALIHHQELGLPNFESVGRCRRKIQNEREDLQSSESAKRAKTEKEKEYKLACLMIGEFPTG